MRISACQPFAHVHISDMTKRKTLTEAQVLKRVMDEIARHGTQKAFAVEVGISPAYLHDAITGRRALPEKVLDFIQIERATEYREIVK